MSCNAIKTREEEICVCMFSSEPEGRLTVLSVKAMLATLCGGKLVDKLRCEYDPKASELTESLCF